MAKIPTVKGYIDSSQLGVTLMHEHICLNIPEKHSKKVMDYQVELKH